MKEHAGHPLEQRGRCVYWARSLRDQAEACCVPCNARLFQGRLPRNPLRAARALEELREVVAEIAAERERVRLCTHALVLEHAQGDGSRWRRCWLCGHAYDRTKVLADLEHAIRERYRLPPSPWSGAERAQDSE